jgi:predicted PurR-regulated permease PerM
MPPLPAARSLLANGWLLRPLAVAAWLFILQAAKPLLLPLVIAVVFTFVLAPAVHALRRRGVPEWLGAALLLALLLAAVAVPSVWLAAPAARWWQQAPAMLQRLLDSVHGASPALPPGLLDEEGTRLTRAALSQLLSFSVSASATVFLLYFLLLSERWLLALTMEMVPRRRSRALLLGGVREAQRDIGLFVTTMALVSAGLGAATGVALALLGFPNTALWGTVTAVLTFVPYVGPALVTLALLAAGHAVYGPVPLMLAPAGLFLGLHFIESNFISPVVMGLRLRISPVFVFLSVLLWSWLWGIAGAFVAVPLLLGLRAACRRHPRLRVVRRYIDGSASNAPSFAALLAPRRRH